MKYVDASPEYDDWRAERDAEEDALEHDARQREHIAGDEDDDADIPF